MDNEINQAENKPQHKTACGGRLRDPTGYPSAVYRGKKIYFCKQACLRAFKRDPDPFMAGEVEHPIHEDNGN